MVHVECDVRGPAWWITLVRPEAMNSLTSELVAELERAVELAEADPTVHAIVVTGSGRAFCAGADLKAIGAAPEHLAFLARVASVFRRLELSPKPVIAAVNGYALAGGLELVLCCDLVVAARSAQLGDAHANFGLIPGGGSSVRLPRKIGVTRAKYLLYTGAFVSASTLAEWGLVNEVVDDDALEASVAALVEVLAAKSPLGIRRMKQLVEDGLDQPLDVAVRNEIVASEAHLSSHDMREGLEAFAAKRPPSFTGT